MIRLEAKLPKAAARIAEPRDTTMEWKGPGLAVGGPGFWSCSATPLLGGLFMSTLRTLVFPFLEI